MKQSPFFLLTILTLCFVLACLTSVASVSVVALGAVGIGGEVAFGYYEGLNFSTISIAVPVAGMLLLALTAPVLLRRRETATATIIPASVVQEAEEVRALDLTEAYPKAA